jgi:hypothetical protein
MGRIWDRSNDRRILNRTLSAYLVAGTRQAVNLVISLSFFESPAADIAVTSIQEFAIFMPAAALTLEVRIDALIAPTPRTLFTALMTSVH